MVSSFSRYDSPQNSNCKRGLCCLFDVTLRRNNVKFNGKEQTPLIQNILVPVSLCFVKN